jgi:esterase/lipase superfamily enzyme
MNPARRWTTGCILFWFFAAAVSFAAERREIVGRVTDETGAGVPRLVVELLRGGETEHATTDDAGWFRFQVDLEKGAYLLRIALPGTDGASTLIAPDTDRFTVAVGRYHVEGRSRRPAMAAPAPPPPPTPAPPTTAQVPVFFATDRARSTPAEAIGFGDTPAPAGSPLTLGKCVVSVPVKRHVAGELERPTWWTLDWRDWSEDPERHFVIIRRGTLGEQAFWAEAQEQANHVPDGEALLFIHGYNVSFDDAVLRTAQLAWDLSFKGAPIAYSWPSDGHALAYVADKEANEGTVPLLRDFLVSLHTRLRAKRIHIIAHSMGNRALVQALSQISREHLAGEGTLFQNIVLAAPDVDRRVFLELAPAFRSEAARVTLYASDADKALAAAQTLQRFPRAGDANPLLAVAGIDTIDASIINTDFWNHSYFTDARLLNDIRALMKDFNTPLPRFPIQRIGAGDPAQWRFVVAP